MLNLKKLTKGAHSMAVFKTLRSARVFYEFGDQFRVFLSLSVILE